MRLRPSRRNRDRRLPSAGEDAIRAEIAAQTPQTRSPSYRLAFHDPDFLVRDELRPVRLQLELMKPELLLAEHRIDSTIVVFGSARMQDPDLCGPAQLRRKPGCVLDRKRAYDEAQAFRLASAAGQRQGGRRRFVVITGGGPGVMEAANRGAHDVGAVSIGLNVVLPHEQRPNPYITPELCFQFHYFAIRKLHFMLRARALVCFPGGFGTLDELFEALTLIQTGKAKPMPLLLFDEAYWRRVINLEAMAEERTIAPKDVELVKYVESAGQAWDAIARYYGLDAPDARDAREWAAAMCPEKSRSRAPESLPPAGRAVRPPRMARRVGCHAKKILPGGPLRPAVRRMVALVLVWDLVAACAPAGTTPDRPAGTAERERAEATARSPAGAETCRRGRLTDEGVECQAMRGPDGRLYTLVGDLGDPPAAGEACVCGRVAELSSCMQGTTVVVSWIGPPDSCP
jgi:uncharacterized protein (TIGR00730 family)